MFLFLNIFRTIPDLPNVTEFGRKINLNYKIQIYIFIYGGLIRWKSDTKICKLLQMI